MTTIGLVLLLPRKVSYCHTVPIAFVQVFPSTRPWPLPLTTAVPPRWTARARPAARTARAPPDRGRRRTDTTTPSRTLSPWCARRRRALRRPLSPLEEGQIAQKALTLLAFIHSHLLKRLLQKSGRGSQGGRRGRRSKLLRTLGHHVSARTSRTNGKAGHNHQIDTRYCIQ